MTKFNIPQNIDAEKTLLGMLLFDNKSYDKILDIISVEDFYSSKHRIIYKVISLLLNKNEPADFIIITDILNSIKQLDEIGGISFLSNLTEDICTSANIIYYAKIIKEKALQRNLLSLSYEIQNHINDGGNIEESIAIIENSLTDILIGNKTEIKTISDITSKTIKQLENVFNNPSSIVGVSSGFEYIDKHTFGWKKGELIVVAGRPGMGKSAIAKSFALASANKEIPTAIINIEMSDEQQGTRIISDTARINHENLNRGDLTEEEQTKLFNTVSSLNTLPLYFVTNQYITDAKVSAITKKFKIIHNIGLLIIDHLQLIKSEQKFKSRYEEITHIIREMKLLAVRLQIPIIILSQLNRECEKRANKRPILSDLRESGAIEENADIVAFLYRDEFYNKDSELKGIAEFIIEKARSSKTGVIKLNWLPQFVSFSNYYNPEITDNPYEENPEFYF